MKVLSKWSKDVHHAMIDRNMGIKDVANHFKWSRQYATRIINGAKFSENAMLDISEYLG